MLDPAQLQGVIYEKRNHIAYITLNNPERLNALSEAMKRELPLVWEDVKTDPDIRVAIVTGAGNRGFCTGMDVRAAAETGGPAATREDPGDHRSLRLTALHCEVWKPVITAVNGVCAGGGLHFVADSDLVLCAEHATFLDTHAFVGQVAATEFIGLARRIPFEAVMRMILVGRYERMTAQRAYELGLVSEVVPGERLLDRATEIAGWICEASPAAVQRSKRALWASLDRGLDEALREGYRILREHWSHPDYLEGPRAFAERRKPNWSTP